ncbi:MAG: ABC transporter [Chloroflexi bacterium]|nr:MAG: ABC transporter [Chloroflexota bacterium]
MTGLLRFLEHHALLYRRTWKGSMFVSFISPLLFLGAMGFGLGSLISRGPVGTVDGVTYVAFLGPGLLAATTMQTAYVEATYPILAKIQWLRTYDGMLATPLTIGNVVSGELTWMAFRLMMAAVTFFIVMVLFGLIHSPLAALAILVAIVNGLAFGAPILAFTATQHTDSAFSVIGRFLITPLFLLGGAFFPIHQLPKLLQDLAWLTPLAHAVTLARGLTTGHVASSAAIDMLVLLGYAAIGLVAATITMRRRLSK